MKPQDYLFKIIQYSPLAGAGLVFFPDDMVGMWKYITPTLIIYACYVCAVKPWLELQRNAHARALELQRSIQTLEMIKQIQSSGKQPIESISNTAEGCVVRLLEPRQVTPDKKSEGSDLTIVR